MFFPNLQLSCEFMPTVPSDSSSWQVRVEPDVVFWTLCSLRCFSAHHIYKEWLLWISSRLEPVWSFFYVWKSKKDQQFLKYSNESVWHQQPLHKGQSHRVHIFPPILMLNIFNSSCMILCIALLQHDFMHCSAAAWLADWMNVQVYRWSYWCVWCVYVW